jgi:hypothetical protein
LFKEIMFGKLILLPYGFPIDTPMIEALRVTRDLVDGLWHIKTTRVTPSTQMQVAWFRFHVYPGTPTHTT